MRAAAGEATAVLSVLANTNRLLLLCQLCKGEKCVGELEDLLDLHQPTLSQQLGVLRAENLVHTRREGKKIYYSIADPRVHALLGTLYELYCPPMKGAAP
ncbi:MAG: transcriptional regulator [Elusimicrobia bacterium]|nr:MAG: transcriptional regulator [Elusimicrobiota bacterium]